MYEKREEYMELLDDGKIKETYKSGDNSYEVDGKSCTCSTFAQYFYCRHIVLYRTRHSLPLFDVHYFHPSLHKNSEVTPRPHISAGREDEEDNSPPSPGLAMMMEEAANKKKTRTQAKKFNEGFDVGKGLAEILAIYDEEAIWIPLGSL